VSLTDRPGEIREDHVIALLEVGLDLGDQVLFFCSHGRAPQYLLNSVDATFTLGLMLEEIVTDLMNWPPLKVLGLALPTGLEHRGRVFQNLRRA
jgi:hypothetical protein